MNWLRSTLAIYTRELLAYFYSPMYYAVATAFLLLLGLAFYFSVGVSSPQAPPPPAELSSVFHASVFFLTFIIPVVTMRLFAEEFRHGTIEPLMTAPLSDWQVVLGKYFAALTVFVALYLPTAVFAVTLFIVGEPDPGKMAMGYVGVLLAAGLFTAVGLLASTLTRDQVVAAILGIIFNLSFWLVNAATRFDRVRETEWLREALRYVVFYRHFDTMVSGVADSRDIVYFVSFIVFLLFVAVRVVESRKWRV